MSLGRITLKSKKGKLVYDVKLKRFDVVDTLYGFPGGGAVTLEQSVEMRQALSNAKGYRSFNTERATETQNIPQENIRQFLSYYTGDPQEASLRRLDSLWTHNAKPSELYAEFHY